MNGDNVFVLLWKIYVSGNCLLFFAKEAQESEFQKSELDFIEQSNKAEIHNI